MRSTLMLVPLVVFAAACQGTGTTLPLDDQHIAPSLDQQVTRIMENTGPFVFLLADGSGWNVVIAQDPRHRCSGNPMPHEFVEVQRVPAGASGKVHEFIKGWDLQAQVWDVSPFDCAAVLSEGPVIEGTVNLVAKNYFQFWTGQQPEAFSFEANGAFHAFIDCKFDPSSGYGCKARINDRKAF